MVYKSGQIGDGFLLLLARADGSNTAQTALKKGVYLVFVHIGTDVAVIAVAQDRDIIEKHIRSLQTELVEPAVFGYHMFQVVVRKVIVGLYTEQVVSRKSGHKNHLL